MPGDYGSHTDYMGWVRTDAETRQKAVEKALREAFSGFIEKREVDIIVFSGVGALDLAKGLVGYPSILKPLLAVCNLAARAVERDLSIKNLDTYNPRLDEDQAKVIAGYMKPFLPPYMEIGAVSGIDRVAFVDKEIRKQKGRWEQKVRETLSRCSGLGFEKRMFESGGEEFELDAAIPARGEVKIGVDVKRIEARRDIHKRCDEIMNKATKVKAAYPGSRFGTVIYYPFIDEHGNVRSRLQSENIDGIVFASESVESIESAVKMLLPGLGIGRK